MEVDLPSIGLGEIEHVERVRGKSSRVTCGARTAVTLTLLLLGNRYGPAECFGETCTDLRFDPHAVGAQAFRLHLGTLVADSADFFDLSSVEETPSVEEAQIYRGHDGPSRERPFENGIADTRE